MVDASNVVLFPTPARKLRKSRQDMLHKLGREAMLGLERVVRQTIPETYDALSRDEQVLLVATYATQLLRDTADRLETKVILPRLEAEKERLEQVV